MTGRLDATRRYILRELTSVEGGSTLHNTVLPLTPPSPDETLIQLRGHQRKSATYNYDAPDPVFFKTPTKSSPKKAPLVERLAPTRSSPRRKLNLNTTTEKKANDNTMMKRKLRLQNMNHNMDSVKNLKALSHAQLINLIDDLLKATPNFKETLMSLVPMPDLTPIEARLKVLQRNVLKAFPRNIWGNQDGSFSYLRVKAHLEAFKKECLDFGHQLIESEHWPSVFEYILTAWKLTLGLPDWPSSNCNKTKLACIKFLSTQCIDAFKKSNIDETSLNEIIERLEDLGNDSDVKSCVRLAKDLLTCD